MHFVSSSCLINFLFVFLPLYLHFLFLGILMKVSIHFFRHYKLEKFRIRATLKMLVRDHSFMTLAKNIKKFELPSPHLQPSSFGLTQKGKCTIITGLTFIKKLTLLWEFFLILGIFFVTKTTLKFFSSCFPIWQGLTRNGTLFFCAILKTNLNNFGNKQLGLYFLKKLKQLWGYLRWRLKRFY